jgi:hypothetical protein
MTEDEKHRDFKITIDHEHFKVEQEELTGAQLRALPSPPIGPDRDLYEELKGKHDDRLIEEGTIVEMRNDLHFFTAPHTITPG